MESKPTMNHDNIIANQLAGMSLEEAIFQHGYSSGYERGKREATAPRWVKASERLPNNPDDPLIHYRLHGRKVNGNFYRDDDGMMFFEVRGSTHEPYQIGWKSFQYLEWLDEQPAAVSQDAHEKEIMMQAFDKVRKIFEGRQWVMDGRGSYPYNDDRYKEEVRYMYNEFDEVVKDTWANIKSKSVDYRKAIIAEYLGQHAAGMEGDACDFAEWMRLNCKSSQHGWVDALGKWDTTKGWYELFKQHNP